MTAAVLSGLGSPGIETGRDLPGRVTIRERVMRKAAEQASAQYLGVSVSDVTARVVEYRGGIALALRTPLPVPDLQDTEAVEAATPVITRVGQMQEDLRDTISGMLGRQITRLDVTISGASIAETRRVR